MAGNVVPLFGEDPSSSSAAPGLPGSVGPRVDDQAMTAPDGFAGSVRRAGPSGSAREVAAREVFPAWLRSRGAFWDAASWQVRHAGHLVAFHGVRLPLYWLRLASRSPVGVGRIVRRWWGWTFDSTGSAVRSTLSSTGGDADTYLRVTAQRRQMVRVRLVGVALFLTFLAFTGLSVWDSSDNYSRAAGGLLAVAVLGWIGRSADRPVTSRAVDSEAVPKLTADLILTALGSLGVAELNKALRGDDGVKFPAPIVRDGPAGAPTSTSHPA